MWLREILSLKPAKWPVGRSIRMALGVGTPLIYGLVSGHLLICLWVTLGSMMQSAGEGTGSYRSLFKMTLIAAPIGALGYFAGNLSVLPGPLAIAILTGAAFLAGIINNYGAAYSKGTLQALLGASLAFGLSAELGDQVSYFQVAGLYLIGTAFYLFLLGLEALIDKRRPQRELLADYLTALAKLTETRAHAAPHPSTNSLQDQARSAVIDKYEILYSVLIDTRLANTVRSKENENNAAILQAGDSLFSAVLAHSDTQILEITAVWLRALAEAVQHKKALPECPAHLPSNNQVVLRAINLANRIQFLDVKVGKSSLPFSGMNLSALWKKRHGSLNHLIVGQTAIKSAAKLALCMGIAFSMKYVVTGNHWYWVPLTVSLVMKPELGSVFVRAVLRFIGTAIGVMMGALILMLIPKGFILLGILVVLAACLPWAMLRSYALQTFFLTPLVLILIDLVSPGTHNIDYAGQRLVDTAIGGCIVLIFGYFIWPRSHEKELASSYKNAMQTLATYFELVCTTRETATLQNTRREIYSQLSNLHTQLQKQLSEPPPANLESVKWFPIIEGAERLADCITIYAEKKSESTDSSLASPTSKEIDYINQQMKAIIDETPQMDITTKDKKTHSAFVDETMSELTNISRLLYAKDFKNT